MPAIVFKPVIPRRVLLDPAALVRAIENTLNGVARDIKIDFDVTTQTWNDRPKFTIRKKAGQRIISTKDDVYRFLNDGTRVRYATMTPDFKPKTRVRFIGSNKGRGGVAFVSKLHPRPGIKARHWDKVIKQKWDKLMPKVFQRAIDAEVSKR